MKILIVEDDEHIISFLERGFREDGHTIETAITGLYGEYMALEYFYDVIILDWMLPEKSGLDILRTLRGKQVKTPILFLTAKDTLIDKVDGFRMGADDYLTKPFAYEELFVRVEALYRRTLMQTNKNVLHVKDIVIDLNSKQVRRENENIMLNHKEYELLLFLIKHKNTMVSNAMIESQLWDHEEFINSNVVQVAIYTLRKKLGKELIRNFRGLGYRLND